MPGPAHKVQRRQPRHQRLNEVRRMKHQTDRNRPRSGRHALTLRRAVWTHPHELRHTAASLAVAAGANVKAVQQMLGPPRRR